MTTYKKTEAHGVDLVAPATAVKKKKRNSVGFDLLFCDNFSKRSLCPVQKGRKLYYLRFTEKDKLVTMRRLYERTDESKDRYRLRS